MLPCLHPVSDGHSFQGPAFDFLVYGFGCVVRVENDDRLAPVALKPCPLDASEDFVAVMIKEQDPDLIETGQVHRSGAVVEDLDAEKALIRLFGRKRQLKASFIPLTFQGADLSVNFPSQILIVLSALFRQQVCLPALCHWRVCLPVLRILPALFLRGFP